MSSQPNQRDSDPPAVAQPHQQPSGKKRTKGKRRDNCLIALTRKLTRLLKESDNLEIDLNVASSVLSIPKRRLYDIANVLEGIGYISRSQKNHIRWDMAVDLHQLVARIDPLPILRRYRDDISQASNRRNISREEVREEVREDREEVREEREEREGRDDGASEAKEQGEFDCLQLSLRSLSDDNLFGISGSSR